MNNLNVYSLFDKQLYPLITVEELEIEEIELNSLNTLEDYVYIPQPDDTEEEF